MNLGQQKRILVISDTHLGSDFENLTYLDMIYEFAIKNNITKIVHGGDILDGLIDCKTSPYKTYYSQIKHLIKDYPRDKKIKNYCLYGNHDYAFIENGIDLDQQLKQRSDIVRIGIRKSYLTINKQIFSITHKVAHYKTKQELPLIYNDDIFLRLKGHSHKYKNDIEKNNAIYLPSLSNCNLYEPTQSGLPGFLIIDFYDDYAVITNYVIFKREQKDKELIHNYIKK